VQGFAMGNNYAQNASAAVAATNFHVKIPSLKV
jgi:hypothetical protein